VAGECKIGSGPNPGRLFGSASVPTVLTVPVVSDGFSDPKLPRLLFAWFLEIPRTFKYWKYAEIPINSIDEGISRQLPSPNLCSRSALNQSVNTNGFKDLLEIAKDRAWLVKMTTAINTRWQKQNAKKSTSINCSQNGHSRALELAETGGGR
jgi:hypothetical protein